MSFFTDLQRALSAEFIKVKSSTLIVTATLFPLITSFLVGIASSMQYSVRNDGTDVWMVMAVTVVQLWAIIIIFMAPLMTAMLAGMEHANNMWKHLFVLSNSRQAIFVAKLIAGLALFGISSLLLLAGLIAAGLMLRIVNPGAGFDAPLPFGSVLALVLLNYLGAWAIIAIHCWFGVRLHSFGPAIAFGLVTFLMSLQIIARNDILTKIFPWVLPGNFINSNSLNTSGQWIDWNIATTSVLLSIGGFICVAIIGAWDIARRDVV